MAEGPGSPRLRPVPVAGLVIAGIALVVAVPSHAQRIAQIEFALVGLAAARILLRRVGPGESDVDVAGLDGARIVPAPWSVASSRLARRFERALRRRFPHRNAAPAVPDGVLRMGRHVRLMTASDFNAVVYLRPTIQAIAEALPEPPSHPVLDRLAGMGSPWDARRDGGGLRPDELEPLVTYFEQELLR